MPGLRTDLNAQDRLSIAFYVAARNYMWAAQMLPGSGHYAERAGSMILPHYLLISFCLELYLKGFLAKKGMTDKELRAPDLRHALGRLAECARERGLPDDAQRAELISVLDEQHARHRYRYIDLNATYQMVNIALVHEVLNRMDTTVCAEIDAKGMFTS